MKNKKQDKEESVGLIITIVVIFVIISLILSQAEIYNLKIQLKEMQEQECWEEEVVDKVELTNKRMVQYPEDYIVNEVINMTLICYLPENFCLIKTTKQICEEK